MFEILPGWGIPEDELHWSYARSGGPGGQNVNKVASKAILRWDVEASPSVPPAVKSRFREQQRHRITTMGELLVTSERYRDQERNRQDCLEKLMTMLRQAAVIPKSRKATRPTRASHQRRLSAKKHAASRKAQRRPGDD